MMKKLSLTMVLLALLLSFGALFKLGDPSVEAAGAQQSNVPVSITVKTYFDAFNIITTTLGDRWFDEANDKLYTLVANAWNSGSVIPVSQPGSPSTGNQWFNEETNKLYTYGESSWDGGVTLAVSQPSFLYGQTLAVDTNLADSSGYTFGFWVINGVVYQNLPVDHSFTLTSANEFQAVYHDNDTYYVAFMDTNGKILKVDYVDQSGTDDAVPPSTAALSKPGFTVSGWNGTYSDVSGNAIVKVAYTLSNATMYTLNAVNGTGDGAYAFDSYVTVTPDAAPSGQVFHHWDVDGVIVSYQATYDFTLLKNTTITAHYAVSAATDAPFVSLSHVPGIRSGYKSYVGQFYLPSGYTLVEYGTLYTDDALATIDFNTSGVTRQPSTKYVASTGEYLVSYNEANVTSVVAYLVCKNASNELATVYSEVIAHEVINAGFETATLSGWNSYMIWKNEAGISAFVPDRVVNGTYFDGNYSYNRDGSWNFGIVGGSVTWGQAEERMGHMRSSNFVLTGSGWISFKLGGGKTTSLAYVSVRKTSDNTEVARFGNRHWNNTTLAGQGNAEAYMFQYYYDLSDYIGTSLYFTLTDSSSYNWTILSADAFNTYYPTALTPSADQTAVDIIPVIYGAGSATSTFQTFYTGIDNWQDPQGILQWDGIRGRTNKSCGDGCLGVVRSPAFKTSETNKYLKWDWQGDIRKDKQIFLSVKEVGTNIEVMRLVKRANLNIDGDQGATNAHWADLSSLDTSKEYYIELVDNYTGGWGLISIYNLRLSTTQGTAGDDAFIITGIVTNYTYVK
jgi:hypothetical protein